MNASPESKQNGNAAAGSDPVTAILEVLQRGQKFLVCSHAHPDGDAVGSVLALGLLLEQMGKQADMVSADRVPHLYRLLPRAQDLRIVKHVEGAYDAVILLECDGLERAGMLGLDSFFLINIDHHYSGRDFAQLNWIDQSAASVGQMIYRLAKVAGANITAEIATCLYTTLLTDTGGFTYGSIDASTFEIAGELARAGADPVRIAQQICFSSPMSKMLLLGTALQNLRREGRVSWLWITHQDMVRTCAAEEDCEGIVNFAVGIVDIQAAAFMRELPDGQIRVSLRSKGRINVAAVAERLGGGGHRNAAGCTLSGPLASVLEDVPALLREALSNEETSTRNQTELH